MTLPIDVRIVAGQLVHELEEKRRAADVVPIGLAVIQRDPQRWLDALLGVNQGARVQAARDIRSVLEPPPAWHRQTALGLCVCAALRGESWPMPMNTASRMLGVTSAELRVLIDGGALRRGPNGWGVHAGDLFHVVVVGKPRLRAV